MKTSHPPQYQSSPSPDTPAKESRGRVVIHRRSKRVDGQAGQVDAGRGITTVLRCFGVGPSDQRTNSSPPLSTSSTSSSRLQSIRTPQPPSVPFPFTRPTVEDRRHALPVLAGGWASFSSASVVRCDVVEVPLWRQACRRGDWGRLQPRSYGAWAAAGRLVDSGGSL